VAVGVGLGVKVGLGVNVIVGVGVSVANRLGISATPEQDRAVSVRITTTIDILRMLFIWSPLNISS
jgi:hypothetical protein